MHAENTESTFCFTESRFSGGASDTTHLVRIMQGQQTQGHLSFTSLWLSARLIQRDRWNCEIQYFTTLQEKTFWHAWNLPENGIKIKCGELWVPHQCGSTRHLFIFWVASPSIKKLWVYGIKEGRWGWVGANTLAVLAMRKARSPAWSCMHVYADVCSQACMKRTNVCFTHETYKSLIHVSLHITCCVCLCVYFKSILDIIKLWKAGGAVLWNNRPSAVYIAARPPTQLLKCRGTLNKRHTAALYAVCRRNMFVRAHVFCYAYESN